MCDKYFLQILNTCDHRFWPFSSLQISYTNTTYIFYHHILNPSYSFSPIKCLMSLYASKRIKYWYDTCFPSSLCIIVVFIRFSNSVTISLEASLFKCRKLSSFVKLFSVIWLRFNNENINLSPINGLNTSDRSRLNEYLLTPGSWR